MQHPLFALLLLAFTAVCSGSRDEWLGQWRDDGTCLAGTKISTCCCPTGTISIYDFNPHQPEMPLEANELYIKTPLGGDLCALFALTQFEGIFTLSADGSSASIVAYDVPFVAVRTGASISFGTSALPTCTSLSTLTFGSCIEPSGVSRVDAAGSNCAQYADVSCSGTTCAARATSRNCALAQTCGDFDATTEHFNGGFANFQLPTANGGGPTIGLTTGESWSTTTQSLADGVYFQFEGLVVACYEEGSTLLNTLTAIYRPDGSSSSCTNSACSSSSSTVAWQASRTCVKLTTGLSGTDFNHYEADASCTAAAGQRIYKTTQATTSASAYGVVIECLVFENSTVLVQGIDPSTTNLLCRTSVDTKTGISTAQESSCTTASGQTSLGLIHSFYVTSVDSSYISGSDTLYSNFRSGGSRYEIGVTLQNVGCTVTGGGSCSDVSLNPSFGLATDLGYPLNTTNFLTTNPLSSGDFTKAVVVHFVAQANVKTAGFYWRMASPGARPGDWGRVQDNSFVSGACTSAANMKSCTMTSAPAVCMAAGEPEDDDICATSYAGHRSIVHELLVAYNIPIFGNRETMYIRADWDWEFSAAFVQNDFRFAPFGAFAYCDLGNEGFGSGDFPYRYLTTTGESMMFNASGGTSTAPTAFTWNAPTTGCATTTASASTWPSDFTMGACTSTDVGRRYHYTTANTTDGRFGMTAMTSESSKSAFSMAVDPFALAASFQVNMLSELLASVTSCSKKRVSLFGFVIGSGLSALAPSEPFADDVPSLQSIGSNVSVGVSLDFKSDLQYKTAAGAWKEGSATLRTTTVVDFYMNVAGKDASTAQALATAMNSGTMVYTTLADVEDAESIRWAVRIRQNDAYNDLSAGTDNATFWGSYHNPAVVSSSSSSSSTGDDNSTDIPDNAASSVSATECLMTVLVILTVLATGQ